MSKPLANVNLFWASALVEELVRSGVRTFCVSPGSRSTPLALAIARNRRVESVVHIDERGSAFFALGVARASGRPAAWVTTSGTAVANGFPAIIEADRDEVPLICLTADRPPELRDVGANQTIDQVKIFGNSVRWFFDLPCPGSNSSVDLAQSVAGHAAFRAVSDRGPVHINMMFREPLSPSTTEPIQAKGRAENKPRCVYISAGGSVNDAALRHVMGLLKPEKRGLIVAGGLGSAEDSASVLALSEHLSWPLLPDIRSGLRLTETATTVPHYDLLLFSKAFREQLAPDIVFLVGRPVLSKRLQMYLASERPAVVIQVDRSSRRLDPGFVVTHRVQADPGAFCSALRKEIGAHSAAGDRMESLKHLNQNASAVIDNCLPDKSLAEVSVVRHVTRQLPSDHILFLGNSLSVRHADMFASPGACAVRIYANRGASGIDGNIATAAGTGHGGGAPVTAIVGDLTTLHDLTSLSFLREHPVTLVVLNNNGGGIFSYLPVRNQDDVFDRFFATPQEISFEAIASGFGLVYEKPDSMDRFRDVYRRAVASDGSTIIEILSDRESTFQLFEKVAAELSAVV